MDSTNNWFICKTCKRVFPIKRMLLIHKRVHHEDEGKIIDKRGKEDKNAEVGKRRTVSNNNNPSVVQKTNSKDGKKSKEPISTKTPGLIRKSKENFQKLLVKKAKKNFTPIPSLFTNGNSSLPLPDIKNTTSRTKIPSPHPTKIDEEIELVCLSSDSEPEPESDTDEKDETFDLDSSIFQPVVTVEKSPSSPTTTEKAKEEIVEKEGEEKKSSPSSSSASSTPGNSMQKLSCPVCNWKGVNEKILAIHMQIRHLDKDHLSCLFPGCKEIFQASKELIEHKKTHEPVRPFTCPIESCNRSFFKANHRSAHLKSHVDETKSKKVKNHKLNKTIN